MPPDANHSRSEAHPSDAAVDARRPAPPVPASGPTARPSKLAGHWDLEPGVTFLNHGSFGASPRAVLDAQLEWRRRMEGEPVRFLDRELEASLDAARRQVADFVGASHEDLAFVPNATTGINTILASIRFNVGAELLTTDHEYNASLNALRAAARRDGASVVVARIPFPVRSAGDVVDAIVRSITPRTRLALVSHVTSPTALVLPIGDIVTELGRRNIDVLVDGAHAPGMVPLELEALGAAYYAANGHKWLCAPIGSGFLYVREDRRPDVHPLVISHGANSSRTDRSRFRLEFDWPGTYDPTPFLSLPAAIGFMGTLLPGGWPDLMAANARLALRARDLLCGALGIEPPAPEGLLGSMAAVPLPASSDPDTASGVRDPLAAALFERYSIEVPVIPFPVLAALGPRERQRARLLRISAQVYNDESQFALLAEALETCLGTQGARSAL